MSDFTHYHIQGIFAATAGPLTGLCTETASLLVRWCAPLWIWPALPCPAAAAATAPAPPAATASASAPRAAQARIDLVGDLRCAPPGIPPALCG